MANAKRLHCFSIIILYFTDICVYVYIIEI